MPERGITNVHIFESITKTLGQIEAAEEVIVEVTEAEVAYVGLPAMSIEHKLVNGSTMNLS